MEESITTKLDKPSLLYIPTVQESEAPVEQNAASETATEGEDVTAITAHVSAKVKQSQRTQTRTVMGLLALLLGISLFVQFVIRTADGAFWNVFPAIIITILALMGTVGILMCQNKGKDARALRRKADRLAYGKDKAAVGALVDMLKFEDVQTHRKAKRGLILLLPTLTAGDSDLLGREHRAKLNRILSIGVDDPGYKDISELFTSTTKREVDLRLAILKAFEQVGDERSLVVVKSLADRNARTEGDSLIKEAARECLPYLHSRVGRQTAQKSLLRASSITCVPGSTLLRPAAATPQSSSESLLRPDPTSHS